MLKRAGFALVMMEVGRPGTWTSSGRKVRTRPIFKYS